MLLQLIFNVVVFGVILVGLNFLSRIILRRRPHRQAFYGSQVLASTLGLTETQSTPSATGKYAKRDLSLTVAWVPVSRHKRTYAVEWVVSTAVEYDIEINIRKRMSMVQRLRPGTPFAQQSGATVVEDSFVLQTKPSYIRSQLLASIEFCYEVILSPTSSIRIETKQCSGQWRGDHLSDFTGFIEQWLYPFLETVEQTIVVEQAS